MPQKLYTGSLIYHLYINVLRLWYVSLHKIDRLAEAVEEHRHLIAAIKTGDEAGAAQIMRAHIAGFQTQFAEVLYQGQ